MRKLPTTENLNFKGNFSFPNDGQSSPLFPIYTKVYLDCHFFIMQIPKEIKAQFNELLSCLPPKARNREIGLLWKDKRKQREGKEAKKLKPYTKCPVKT